MAQATKRMKKIEDTPAQLELIPANRNNPFWQTSLFNEVFLLNDVPVKYKEKWEFDEAGPFYQFCNGFRNLCEELRGEDFDSWSERNTINRFIKPVLALLGYNDNCSPSQEPWAEDEPFSVSESGQSKTYKPDLIIVNDPKELKYIERKRGDAKIEEARQLVILPIEAKYWDRIEDARQAQSEDKNRSDKSSKDDANRGMDFDEQCLKYMEILKKDFGILTDGKTWRLYNLELSSGSYKRYFQFNLGRLLMHVNAGLDRTTSDYELFIENAKYFFHIFSKEALYSESGDRRFVDDLLEYSKKYVLRVEEDLKDRFVQAMSVACNGLYKCAKKSGVTSDIAKIRNIAESHLFNILFIKHCEARNVLPLKQSPEYRKISLSNVIDKLEYFDLEKESDGLNLPMLKRVFSKDFQFSTDGTELYDRLLGLTKIVQQGTGSDFSGFEIKGFRETIFSKEEWKFAKELKLSNRDMVNILFELGYSKSDIKGKKYQQIPYNFFSPRQLGSIYESFLEFKLDVASEDMIFAKKQWQSANLSSEKVRKLDVPKVRKGDLFFSPDNKDRKATGSYYTPDYIVQEVVRRVLEPLVSGESAKSIEKLRVVDPAMGSGHFLSGALNYLATKYVDALSKEKNDDISLSVLEAKRRLLSLCLVGIDVNPRAAKLAKLSLWLESAMPGKPLEELDDQLVVADTIFTKDVLGKVRHLLDPNGVTAVVGNPPYGIDFSEDQVGQLFARFKTLHQKHDSFHVFIERMLMDDEWLKFCNIEKYRIGFIIPDTILSLDCFKKLREAFIESNVDADFILNKYDVFEDANVSTLLLIANSIRGARPSLKIGISQTPSDLASVELSPIDVDESRADKTTRFIVRSNSPLNALSSTVDDFFEATAGAQAYEVGKGTPKQTRSMLEDKIYNSTKKLNKKYRPYLYGNDIRMMHKSWRNEEFIQYGPNLSAPRDPKFHEGDRVVVQRIRNPKLEQRLVAAFIDDDSVSSVGLSVLKPREEFKRKVSAKALSVYLNLPSVNGWFKQVNNDVNVKPTVLKTIPIELEMLSFGGVLDDAFRTLAKLAKDEDEATLKSELQSLDKKLFADVKSKKRSRRAA